MVTPHELKSRVQRIVDGRYLAGDFDRLFLWLRRNHRGCKAVKDLGDFVGHSDTRNIGFSWDHAKALFFSLKIHSRMVQGEIPDRETMVARMLATASIEDPAWPKRMLGIGQRRAHKILRGIIARIVHVDGADVKLAHPPDELEKKVFDHYYRMVGWRPAFDQSMLIAQLTKVLVSHDLLATRNIPAFGKASDYLARYALTKMHLAKLVFEDREPVTLALGIWINDKNKVPCFAMWALDHEQVGPNVSNAFNIFTTDLLFHELNAWQPIPIMIELQRFFHLPIEMDDETGKMNIIM